MHVRSRFREQQVLACHPEFVGSHPEFVGSHPEFVGSHPEFVGSHPEFVGSPICAHAVVYGTVLSGARVCICE
jgi:hypothetical protein